MEPTPQLIDACRVLINSIDAAQPADKLKAGVIAVLVAIRDELPDSDQPEPCSHLAYVANEAVVAWKSGPFERFQPRLEMLRREVRLQTEKSAFNLMQQ